MLYNAFMKFVGSIKRMGIPCYKNGKFWAYLFAPVFLLSLGLGIFYSFWVVKDFYQASGSYLMTDTMTSLYEDDLDTILKGEAVSAQAEKNLFAKGIKYDNGGVITAADLRKGITTEFKRSNSYFVVKFQSTDSSVVASAVNEILSSGIQAAENAIKGMSSGIKETEYAVSGEFAHVENYRYQYLASSAIFAFFAPFLIYTFLPEKE